MQELLVPRVVEFFSAHWKSIGTKDSLNGMISKKTGLPSPCENWMSASVAAKMSRASQRSCLREKDHAYPLLELFGIDIPLLYGEWHPAFERLQLEILKSQMTSQFSHGSLKQAHLRCWHGPQNVLLNPEILRCSGLTTLDLITQ